MSGETQFPTTRSQTVVEVHKADRKIMIDMCDAADYAELHVPAGALSERVAIHKMVDTALDILEGKSPSVLEVERLVTMRCAAPKEAA